jgi:hypothetical protein
VADADATGATSSPSDAGREITTIARSAIPIIAAIKTRGEVDCFGAALGFGAGAGLATGVVETFTADGSFTPPTGTGGITKLFAEDDFFVADFFAALFLRAGAFFAAFFAAFFTTFLAAAFFLAGAFLATFLAAAFFFAGAFFATFLTTFLAAAFFLAGAFFFTATM